MASPASPAPALPAPVLDQLAPRLSQIVQQAKVTSFAIVARDPQTGALRVYASPGAMEDLREIVSEKWSFTDASETGWTS